MAKQKHNTRRRVVPPSQTPTKPEIKYADAKLIRLCVTIVAEMAAYHGSGDVDPDGNSVHAEPIWSRHQDRATRAIDAAAAIPATTWAGLAAKAAAMQAIMDDQTDFALVERIELYYRAVAADAHRLAKDQHEKERQAAFIKEKANAAIAAMDAVETRAAS